MWHVITRIVPPLMLATALGVARIGVAGAATMAPAHTWHGEVAKVGTLMGTSQSFSFVDRAKTYTADYKTTTRFVMGMASEIKVGTNVTVTGTLKGAVVTASQLSIWPSTSSWSTPRRETTSVIVFPVSSTSLRLFAMLDHR